LSIGDIETDKNDRPLNPPKFLSAEVLWNPFDDIVPRTIKKATTIDNVASKKKTRKATKNLNLLSFGDEEEESMKTSKKSKYRWH
jgi:peptidyl-prolyl cis-trans isomerase SDCCAG10